MRKLISKLVVISCTMSGGISSVFGGINLSWDVSPDAQADGAVAGYKIYYGPMDTEIVTMGIDTNVLTASLTPQKLYNFTVLAFDGHGEESEFSNFLPFFTPDGNQTDVNITWDHSPDATMSGAVAGYKVRYGFATTVQDVGLATSFTVNDIPLGQPYFFAVSAYGPNGAESEPSNVVVFVDTGLNNDNPNEEIAPPKIATFSFGASEDGTNPGDQPNSDPNQSVQVQNLLGVPPVILANVNSNRTQLTVWGTMGASVTVQRSSDLGAPDRWVTVTNITLETQVQSEDTQSGTTVPPIIQKALTPAISTWEMERPTAEIVLYRLLQQQDYEILASQSLRDQGFTTRLVVVRLEGNASYNLCYVAEEQAFIHYDANSQSVTLRQSAGGLREIADSVSSLLKQSWTSASEFVMVGNQRQIVTTVSKAVTAPFVQPRNISEKSLAVGF